MAGAADETADSILLGEVVSLDTAGTGAEALAVKGNRILAVGARDEVMGLRGGHTEVHDFGTAAIIPGFNDTHAHMDTEGLKLMRPSLAGASSIADVQAVIRDLAGRTPAGDWVVTMPVGEPPFYFGGPAALAEGRMPTAVELDAAAPDHPVCILPPSGYWGKPPCYAAVNSLALKLNGVDRHTRPRIEGLEILKDGAGAPTGVFVDRNPHESILLDLLPEVPRYSHEERHQGIREALKAYHAKGTTSIYEGHGCSSQAIQIYQDLRNAGELTMRVGAVVSPAWSSVDEAAAIMRDWLGYARGQGLGDDMLRASGVFVGLGGDPAAVRLEQEQGWDTGYWSFHRQAFGPEEFEQLCLLAAEHGLRVHTISSMGKQRDILPVFRRADERFGIRNRRWVLEHMSHAGPEDPAAVTALGLGVTVIPAYHLWKNGAAFLDLDDSAKDWVVPVKHLQEAGVTVAAGTDNTPYDPLAVMAAMMCREERTTGDVIGEAGRVSAGAALRALTSAGAWFTFDEDRKGRLIPGQLADCAVLSANPLTTDPHAFERIECLATMVGGAFVHDAR